jgi:hypothetical protein
VVEDTLARYIGDRGIFRRRVVVGFGAVDLPR